MTQEEKQLLLKDLCARLPYYTELYSNVAGDGWAILTPVVISNLMNATDKLVIKPYLRLMSSMTEEEKHELYNIRPYFINSDNIVSGTQCNTFIQSSECQDWLNEHYFDYRGLIEKGLALEATEDMYK